MGLGVLASGAREVRPRFFTAAAHAVSECVSRAEREEGMLVPAVATLKAVSAKVALAVGMTAVAEGVDRPCIYATFQHNQDEVRMKQLISKMRWNPQYLPLVGM
jgi:malic enzyme